MDLLVDTFSSPRLRTVSHPIVDGFRAATNVSATRIFRMSGNSGISRRSLVIAGATLGAPLKLAAQDRGVETVEVTDSETATIDGRIWDKPMVAGKTVDTVHRSVLLRFPAMAEPIAAKSAKGYAIARVDLVLAYDGYEIVPPEYTCRVGLGQKVWTENPPTWHIQAWPLRRPWIADPLLGPTSPTSTAAGIGPNTAPRTQKAIGTRRWKRRNCRSASLKRASTSPVCS
jgi:hypothetical protein